MWLERFLIIVPSLSYKYLPYSWGTYRPQPVEIVITVSTFAAMALLYVLFAKFVPVISVWEMKVGLHDARQETATAWQETATAWSAKALAERPPVAERTTTRRAESFGGTQP
jgi:hypothetical protein